MNRALSIIGAPSSAGAYAPGQEKSPDAFRRHGLIQTLIQAGHQIHDRGDVPGFRWRPDAAHPKTMNLEIVTRVAAAVADQVVAAMYAGEVVLVLGGDCTIELGTVAGALRDEASVALVYIDFDTDLNPPEASDGALDWTGVAHLLGLPGTAKELSGLGPRQPMLGPADILFFGVNNITSNEAETIRELGIKTIALSEVKVDPVAAANRAVAWSSRYKRLLVHLDVDVLSYTSFPIAENVRRCEVLTLDEVSAALSPLLAAPNWRALTLTEVNPDHAPDESGSFLDLIAMLTRVFSA